MKTRALIVLAVLASLVAGGCKAKQPTSLERKEAATLVSEAEFALQLKDFARVEGLFTKAASLCPDAGKFWVDLGSIRMRMGKKELGREAYKSGLAAYAAAVAADPKEPQLLLLQVHVLALLGRTGEARAMLAKAQKIFPEHRVVRAFVEGKQLDKMIADPRFKEIAL